MTKKTYANLYSTKRWKRLRTEIFKRDMYQCQQTGALLNHKYPSPYSPVADHITPHKGNQKLFWDADNIQTVSKAYHDSVKQRFEKTGILRGYDVDGKPTDTNHPWNAHKRAPSA